MDDKKKKIGLDTIIIVILAVVGFVTFFYLFKDVLFYEYKTEIDVKETEVALDINLANGLRLASVEQYSDAVKYFDQLNFEDLSNEDQYVVLTTYLYVDQAQKAINLDQTFDKNIVEYYFEKGDMEKLRNLKTDSELIRFEIAALEKDYEKIIKLQDADRLTIDNKRARIIANAYYALGEREGALNFASFVLHDGINPWADEGLQHHQLNIDTGVVQKNDSPFLLVLIAVLITLSIFLGYSFYKRFKSKRSEAVNESTEKDKEMKVEQEEVVDSGSIEKVSNDDPKYRYYADDI